MLQLYKNCITMGTLFLFTYMGIELNEPTFTCSISTMETREQCEKSVQS